MPSPGIVRWRLFLKHKPYKGRGKDVTLHRPQLRQEGVGYCNPLKERKQALQRGSCRGRSHCRAGEGKVEIAEGCERKAHKNSIRHWWRRQLLSKWRKSTDGRSGLGRSEGQKRREWGWQS